MLLHVQLWPVLALAIVLQAGVSVANTVVPGLSYLPPLPGKPKPTLIEVGTPAFSIPGASPSSGMLLPALDPPAGVDGSAAAAGASQPSRGTVKDSLPTESCTKSCPFDYSPVCGSDGITYTNDCTFSVASCRKSNLVLEGVGPCGSPSVSSFPDSPPPVPPPPPPPPSAPSPTRPPVVIPFPSDTPTFQTAPGSGVIPFPPSLASLGGTSDQGVPEDSLPLVKPASGCSEACTKIYTPLCGTDGVTYNNKCLLEVAACKGRARGLGLSVAHEGTCESVSVDVGSALVDSVDVRGQSGGSLSCDKQCTKILDLVCGTDGRTYNSPCLLEIASCESVTLNNIPISVDYKGSCASTVGSFESAPVQQGAVAVVSQGSSCPEACTKIFSPVCGNDDQTYNNECILEVAACKSRSAGGAELLKAFDGPCVAALPRGPDCNEMCDKTFLPVCGSDGETYNNICLLKLADCQKTFATISMAREGPCETTSAAGLSTDPRPEISTDPSQSAIDILSAAVPVSVDEGSLLEHTVHVHDSSVPADTTGDLSSCNKQCTKILDLVCGTDGNTYNSPCLLEIASCESITLNNIPISVDYKGSCASALDGVGGSPVAEPERISTGQQDFTSVSSQGSSCPEACTKIYSPVCGSDDQTYSNDCVLEVAACKSRSAGASELFKVLDGPCVAAFPRGPACDEMCDKTFIPVCGSDGETYNNVCLLNLADCLNPFATISLASDGPCETSAAAGVSTDPRPDISTGPSQSGVDSPSSGVQQEYLPPV